MPHGRVSSRFVITVSLLVKWLMTGVGRGGGGGDSFPPPLPPPSSTTVTGAIAAIATAEDVQQPVVTFALRF